MTAWLAETATAPPVWFSEDEQEAMLEWASHYPIVSLSRVDDECESRPASVLTVLG